MVLADILSKRFSASLLFFAKCRPDMILESRTASLLLINRFKKKTSTPRLPMHIM